MIEKQTILKIAVLTDILEAELKALNPIKNYNNVVGVSKLVGLQNKCTSVRMEFDKAYGKKAIEAGPIYDMIDEAIENALKLYKDGSKNINVL